MTLVSRLAVYSSAVYPWLPANSETVALRSLLATSWIRWWPCERSAFAHHPAQSDGWESHTDRIPPLARFPPPGVAAPGPRYRCADLLRIRRVLAARPGHSVSRKPPRGEPAAKAPSDEGPTPIALVLIDDNRLLREGLTRMIQSQPGFRVLAASADAAEALEKVREAKPDVVLVDLGLENHDSLRLTATVHKEVPVARVIVMGLLPGHEEVAQYVRAGASGFIMKDASFEDLVATIRTVADGGEVLPRALTPSLFSEIARGASRNRAMALESVRLTARERQVIDLLTEGLSNKEIATRMHIAIHTVKSHVHNVLEKLALRSRLEVAAFSHGAGDFRTRLPSA